MVTIQGIPHNVPADKAAILRSRLSRDIISFCDSTGVQKIRIMIDTNQISKGEKIELFSKNKENQNTEQNERKDDSIEQKAQKYQAQEPDYTFDLLVLNKKVEDNLLTSVDSIKVESTIYDAWGLKEIQPFPRTVLNLHGEPGTGKTLSAHATADRLGRKILIASYADIESKFHGDGPKNLKAIFYAAERDNAVLFIDEADSLLSKRLTEVNSGSEQAINSMRSQLLICLEQFKGIVIFATNLVENYDKAFETRVKHIHFPMPDRECRYRIWQNHLPEKLPLADDVSLEKLAEISDICGRDIREAVIDASIKTALEQVNKGLNPLDSQIKLSTLVQAIEQKKSERINQSSRQLNPEEKEEVLDKVKQAWEKQSSEHKSSEEE
ncbi:MAG: ATP-binding protein [Cyanobacteria bacterium P01_G01_bin.39]